MADIYLLHRKNRRQYASCYQELANKNQSVHSFILLGEAYIKIQEPERAIKAYEGEWWTKRVIQRDSLHLEIGCSIYIIFRLTSASLTIDFFLDLLLHLFRGSEAQSE